MHFIPLGASILLSNVGPEHIVGLAGGGASSGFAQANFELLACFIIMLLAWVFVPVYMASGVFTMPEYLRKRYGGTRIQVLLAVYSLLAYVLTKISVSISAGALFLRQAMGLNLYPSAIFMLVVSGVFTVFGGLTAVVWTDFIQSIIMILGSFVLLIITMVKVGGLSELMTRYLDERPEVLIRNQTCGIPMEDSLHLIQDAQTGTLPWPGVFIGALTVGIWYWCTDQVIVQRTLSARNVTHARIGCVIAAYGKILPFFLFVIPGMVSRVMWVNEIGCVVPGQCKEACDNEAGCTNFAYPFLVLRLMPSGVRGIMIAVMLSAGVSSLTSVFNSASTIFSIDIYRKFRPKAGEIELLITGRCFIAILAVLSILWVPVIEHGVGAKLFTYLQTIQAYMGPQICALFLMAVFIPRVNEAGAFWGLLIGLVIGILRFIFEFGVYPEAKCGEEAYQPAWVKLHFLYVAIFLFFLSIFVTVVISLFTSPISSLSVSSCA